ncbi:MAG: Holliday junction branch migration protein RuvA [Eubacteriales bacterium]
MYHYIKGVLTKLCGAYAVLESCGVGYKLYITLSTSEKLSGFYQKETLLYAYLNIKDDAEELYGFYSEEEQQTFTKLLTVSGVGPKAAISLLSAFTPGQLSFAVSAGDAKAITKANGIGLKTAQKIIIELKGKLDLSGEAGEPDGGVLPDAIGALTSLGYTKSEAISAVSGLDQSLPLEEIIKAAFEKLNRF